MAPGTKHQTSISLEGEQVQPRRTALSVFGIILFLCVFTVGGVYLLYRSAQSGRDKIEFRQNEITMPLADNVDSE
jgi:hypothetical protein